MTHRVDYDMPQTSRHLRYEVRMFDETAQLLMARRFSEETTKFALLESFAVHARVLYQVFFLPASYATDILAEHFFDNPKTWHDLRGNVPAALSDVAKRVNKEIVHASYNCVVVDRRQHAGGEPRSLAHGFAETVRAG